MIISGNEKLSKMKECVVTPNEKDEFFIKERCLILEMWNRPEDEEVSIARARVSGRHNALPPGYKHC